MQIWSNYLVVFAGIAVGIALFIALIQRRKKQETTSWVLLTGFAIMLSFSFWSYLRIHTFSKLMYFGKQIQPILIRHKVEKGGYPKDMEELDKFSLYQAEKFWAMYPFRSEFQLRTKVVGENLAYVFYSFGFDGDDDSLALTYSLNSMMPMSPFVDGDIVISKGTLKN